MADNEKLDPGEDRRADLEAAIAKVESAQPEQPEPVEQQAQPEPEPTGRSAQPNASADPTLPQSASPAAPPTQETAPEQKTETQPAPKRKEKGPTAPIDWSPEERLKFSELPDWAQQRIHQREAHIANTLKETTEARRLAEQFVRIVEPYRPMMQAEGVSNPLQAIDNLLKSAATLQIGTPKQKAKVIAHFTKHYGVDIDDLAEAIDGPVSKNPEQDALDRAIEQRLAPVLAPVNQLLQQVGMAQQQQQYQIQHQAVQSVADFENNPQYEYFDAVRPVMADLLDLAAQRGEPMSLEDAYHRACAYSPAIAQHIAAKNMNGVASQQQQHIAQKQNAASSIVGTRGGSAGGAPNLGEMSLRDAIAAQMGGTQRI